MQVFDWEYNKESIGSWIDGPKYCGRELPPTFNSTTNRMKVLFRSNPTIQNDGFRAIWSENCGGIFTATSREQYIESPNYPDYYPSNKLCTYTILAPLNKEAWVEFVDFEVEGREYNSFINALQR